MSANTAYHLWGYPNIIVSFCIFIDMLRLHRHAWREAGRRQWLWLVLAIVSFAFLFGIPLAIVYLFTARAAVARADASCIADRRARRNARRASRPRATAPPVAAVKASQPYGQGVADFPVSTRRKCSCENGRLRCNSCQNGYNHPSGGQPVPCSRCDGGYLTCSTCGGSGWLS